MSLRPAYLTLTNLFSALRLLPINDREKDTEILALRRQTTVPERQLGTDRTKFTPADRAFLAALLTPACHARPCVDSGYWSDPTPYCAGTTT
ncbi:hypothetical protein OG746_37845 [Streptomyces sp. NBC_01016]|uniref:hypothetical protein n=1 Tax=Streptomyces sp. NBC_01016 TaxID=2903720 RepID=UPI00224FFB15|nr:hypothetical protein [Streptomyces sp. NBC_01016]MCX4834478.1 hypothetical protein [Streptomyces sp. NBC_01016]